MATATRHHSIMNPARRRARRNKPRRHLSAKQIRAGFGGKRRKVALKSKHHRPRTNPRKRGKPMAPRTFLKKAKRVEYAEFKPSEHRQVTRSYTGGRRSRSRKTHEFRAKNRARAAKKRNARRRSNPGEILSLTLGNPAKRRSMAARRKANRASARRTNARHHRKHHRKNTGHRINARHHRVRHHHRRNPGMNVTNLFTEGLSALVGMAGSRLLTQAVLGAQNIGAYGYAGNAAATAVLAGLAHMFFKGKPAVRDGIIIGGAAGILARAMSDYTPLGGYLTQAGFAGMPAGDYSAGGSAGLGLYLPTNAVVPARYIGSSAMTEMPDGWGPQAVSTATAGMGMGPRSRGSVRAGGRY